MVVLTKSLISLLFSISVQRNRNFEIKHRNMSYKQTRLKYKKYNCYNALKANKALQIMHTIAILLKLLK